MKNPLNKINSKELTMVLCTTLNILCMIASLVIVFYANHNNAPIDLKGDSHGG